MKTDKKRKSKDPRQPEYDSAWKDIIEEHFEPFLEFFFSNIHKDIAKKGDNTKKYNIKFELIRQLLKHGYDGKYILLYLILSIWFSVYRKAWKRNYPKKSAK